MRKESRYEIEWKDLMEADKEILSEYDSAPDDSNISFNNLPISKTIQERVEPEKHQIALSVFYTPFLMYKNGNKIFEITENVCLMLKNTNMNGVMYDQFKTPYRAQYLIIPNGLLSLKDGSFIEGIMVWYSGSEIILSIDEVDENGKGFTSAKRIPINNNDIEIKDQVRKWVKNTTDDSFYNLIVGVFDFVLNAMMYITQHDADLVEELPEEINPAIAKMKGMKKQEYSRKLKETTFLRIKVGQNIKLDDDSKEAYKTGTHRTHRTLVMGHWQHYWYGPRDGERTKLNKWKEPFWIGREDLPVRNLPHVA